MGCGPCRGEWPAHKETLDPQVVGALDLFLALLQGSPAQESLAVFLVEPGNLEVLLALLVRPRSLPLVPDRVCKVHPACPSCSLCRGPACQGGRIGPLEPQTCVVTSPAPVTPSP